MLDQVDGGDLGHPRRLARWFEYHSDLAAAAAWTAQTLREARKGVYS
jgi:hypothetical protein